jgi:hypothetical protein
MGYPKSVYSKVKPKMTQEEALEKAKAEKPKFRTNSERVKSGKIDTVIAQLEKIKAGHPEAKLVQGYYGSSVEIQYREQIPAEERVRRILSDDRDRWYNDRYRAESKYDDAQWEAEQKAAKTATANTARHCSCCACSRGL